MGRNVNIWPHKARHRQRCGPNCLLGGQRRWTFHLASEIQAKEQGPVRHHQRLFRCFRLHAVRHPPIPGLPEQEEGRRGRSGNDQRGQVRRCLYYRYGGRKGR